jgi:hypothetical protein
MKRRRKRRNLRSWRRRKRRSQPEKVKVKLTTSGKNVEDLKQGYYGSWMRIIWISWI